LFVCLVSAWSCEAVGQSPIEGIARPSVDQTLSFVRSGRIAQVEVKPGQEVAPGDLLVRLDDRAEALQVEHLKAKAEDTTHVEASQAKYDQAKLDYKKALEADRLNVATPTEVEHAHLDMRIAELSLKLAKFQKEQDRRKYEEARAQLERMRLRSEVGGVVERVFLRKGESADALQKVVRVVNIDPLWVDVLVPISRARHLKAVPLDGSVEPASDQVGEVRIGSAQAEPLRGVIIHKAAVAEPGTEGLIVRLEVSNPERLPAGQRTWVSFPVEKTLPPPATAPAQDLDFSTP
jgi:RND family efflux transporter MFP subunit